LWGSEVGREREIDFGDQRKRKVLGVFVLSQGRRRLKIWGRKVKIFLAYFIYLIELIISYNCQEFDTSHPNSKAP